MRYTGIMTLTRFGFNIPSFTYLGIDDADLFNAVCAAAATAENSGFDSLWVMDHFHQIPAMGSDHEPMLEPYTLLAALAPWTRTARLGALVTGVTYRNPAMLAKTVTTLDIVSGGRAVLGIGAAWFEAEHVAYGYDFPPVGERMDRLEDAVQICRAMFTGGPAIVSGTRHRVAGALNRPRPITPGGPPILVGGGGERRLLAIVARHADACNIFGDPAGVRHKLDVLEAHCERAGRDPAEISKTRIGALVMADTAADAARHRRGAARQAQHWHGQVPGLRSGGRPRRRVRAGGGLVRRRARRADLQRARRHRPRRHRRGGNSAAEQLRLRALDMSAACRGTGSPRAQAPR